MTLYYLHTKLDFGKYEGLMLKQVLEIEITYINWCLINIEDFCISEDVVAEIKKIKPEFMLSKEEQDKLDIKYSNWESDQYEYVDNEDHEDYEKPQSYEEWLEDEFGDDADTAYWNLD